MVRSFSAGTKNDYLFGFQVRRSIAFYQKTEKADILLWLKDHSEGTSVIAKQE